MAGEDYAKVTATFMASTPDAVQIRRAGMGTWIPRSLIHGSDEVKLNSTDRGKELAIRIFRWKAEQSGLLDEDDSQEELLLDLANRPKT